MKKGFTLIEVLVVTALIVLLSSIVLYEAGRARSLARDATRASDLSRIKSAINLYFADNRSFPATITGSTLVPTYMAALPQDPSTQTDYFYAGIDTNGSAGSCESYHLGAATENSGFTGLTQDSDSPAAASTCTGSAADFDGNAAGCSGVSAASPDTCFDLSP